MSVNKFKILQSELDKYVNIPVNMKWDFSGREDSINEYESQILKEVIGSEQDFEILRFSHKTSNNDLTEINYEFNFYDYSLPISANTVNNGNWSSTYVNLGFSIPEIYYFVNSFTKSFFKLDFYDTPDEKTQKNYFTIVIPVQQGLFQTAQLSNLLPPIDIRIPTFKLDFLGDKEGFFIYWLRKRDYIDINKFYMSAKFFDGKTGVFIRMTNTPQTSMTPSKFTFNSNDYFYYFVQLDYNNIVYEVSKTSNGQRVGDVTNPIKWYQYVNPNE